MNRIVQFWVNSYKTDNVAFWVELTSFVFTVWASATLALNAQEPDMRLIYPLFFIGPKYMLQQEEAWLGLCS